MDVVPKERQTMLFSATWPKSIQDMSRTFLRTSNSAHVNIGSADLSASHTVTQVVEFVQKAGSFITYIIIISV
jgi:ATP-dependent RNA helicase DDX5/DBP2